MLKPQRISYFVLSLVFSLVLLLGISWMTGTAVAASESAAAYREGQRGSTASLASNTQAAQAAVCAVETTGDNVTDFTSANATALQNAVNSVAAGTLIKVAGTCAGVQTVSGVDQTVYVNKNLTIQGGYTSTNWLAPSNPTANPTILDAQNSGRVVYVPSGSKTIVLDGLGILNGNGFGGDGGGILVGTNVFWTLRNSVVQNNSTNNLGGGVYNAATQFTMSNVSIRNNTAITMGGGLYSTGINSIANIDTNSVIRDNSSSLDGGGVAVDNGGTLNITNSTVRNNTAADDGGGIIIDSNTAQLTLTNVTVRSNTAGDSGGGIYNNGILNYTNSTVDLNTGSAGGGLHNSSSGNATVTTVLFDQNSAAFGGGIYNVNGTVNASAITVSTNTASDSGGGIWNDGIFSLASSTVSGNTATNGRGGGVLNAAGMNITTSDITENLAPLNDGGGIWNDGPLKITLTKVMTNSTTDQDGGGLHNTDVVTITTSTFANNSATDGGAIYMTNVGSQLIVSSSTFSDNGASGTGTNRGGAIAVNGGILTLLNSTVSGNSADSQGGGVWNNSSGSTLTYATIVNNTGTAGAGIYNDTTGAMSFSKSIIAYNAGTDCASEAVAPDPTDGGYNLIEDGTCQTAGTTLTGDPLLNALAMNGGSTKTHLPQVGSPVIDAIPSGSCVVTVDQRGAIRPVNGACDIGSVEVQGINSAPVAATDDYTLMENETLTVNAATGVLSNDTDINGDVLTAVLDTDVVSGSLTLNSDGSFVYTPDADFCGTDSFTYHANDGQADSNIVTVTLTVNCANDAPVAVADEYTTDENTPLNVAAPGVLENDTDENGDDLTAVLDSDVTSGTLVLNADGSFVYTPDAGFCGTDSFVYHANDGQANSDMVTVTINVTCVNDEPVANDDSYSTGQDVTLNVSAPGVLGNDTDGDGDTLTAVLDEDVAVGTLTLNGDGSFTYVPQAAFTGIVTFTYHAEDGLASSNIATVTINVGDVNQAPTAVADSYSTPHNAALVVAAPGVLDNDNDPDGDTLTAVLDSDVTSGTLVLNANGSFTYTPDNGSCGTDSFTYHANDGQADSNVVTVSIEVACSANLPVAVDDNYTTTQDILLDVAAPGVLANDSDDDGDTLTAVLDTDVAEGSLTLNSDGSFVYSPPTGFSGVVTFTYHVEAAGDSSNVAVVTIVVESDNGTPIAVADSYTTAQDTTLTVAAPGVLANDNDNDPLTAELVSDVSHGSLTLNSDGSFTYTPEAGYCGPDSFTYRASDGSLDSNTATVTITVTCGKQGFTVYLPAVMKPLP